MLAGAFSMSLPITFIHFGDSKELGDSLRIARHNNPHTSIILMGDKSKWGHGYAREASEAIISFCFKELSLRKLTLGVVADNVKAVKLYKTLGFLIEGTYMLHGKYDGKYCNVHRMSLFNRNSPEFKSLHQLS